MKKKLLVITYVILFSLSAMASDFSLNLSVNYNFGTSTFFDTNQKSFAYDGNNFIQKDRNKLGIGCGASLVIPILKDLYIVPAFNINVGHHTYSYQGLNNTDNDESATYFFIIYSGGLNLGYDLIKLRSGMNLFLMAGLNYNFFKADSGMQKEEYKYLGAQLAAGIKYFGSRNFGFQTLCYYRMPLKKENGKEPISFLGLKAGILFRF